MTDSFEAQATRFADEIGEMLETVLPGCVAPLVLEVTGAAAGVITTADEAGLPLRVAGKPVLRLSVGYELAVGASQRWLKVLSSNFSVVPDGKGTPFFRYDFDDEARRVPAAHLNIHAHRDDLIAALVGSGKSQASRNRRKGFIAEGRLPRVSSFHFPLGGAFFPSMSRGRARSGHRGIRPRCAAGGTLGSRRRPVPIPSHAAHGGDSAITRAGGEPAE